MKILPIPLLAADLLDLRSLDEIRDNMPLTEEHLRKRLRFPLYVSRKYDGVRAFQRNDESGPALLSRSLKKIRNKATQAYFTAPERCDGFDGELIIGEPSADNVFQVSGGGTSRIEGDQEAKYYVFDLCAEIFLEIPYEARYEILRGIVQELNDPRIVLVEQYPVRSVEELLAYETQFLEEGYEGIMVRYPSPGYLVPNFAAGKKSENRPNLKEDILFKLKRCEDDEIEITGFYEMMHNANEATLNAFGNTERSSHKANMVPKGTLGGFIGKSIGKFPGAEIRIGHGIGMTEAFRAEVWADIQRDPATWLGRILKYTFQRQGVKDLPRFPKFLGERDKTDL